MKKIYLLFSLFLIFVLGACERFPTDRLVNPATEGTANWGTTWTFFNDTIQTRGSYGPMMFTNWAAIGEGSLQIPSNDDTRWQGNRVMRLDWTGVDCSWYTGGAAYQAAFGLEARPPEGGGRPAYNFTPGSYTKLKFFAKGILRDNIFLRVETGNEGINPKLAADVYPAGMAVITPYYVGTISNAWQEFEITLPAIQTGIMDAVEFAVKISLVNDTGAPSNGGTVYIANIRLVNE